MKIVNANQVIKQIAERERLSKIYNTLYELLSCPGFDQKDFNMVDRDSIDEALSKGEIKSLAELGKRFDDLADYEYREANRLLRNDFRRAV